MEISSNQAKNLLRTIDEEDEYTDEQEEHELRDIQWHSSPFNNSRSELDLKISVCIPRAENISAAQFSSIQRYLLFNNVSDDDEMKKEEETDPISKTWSAQLSCVQTLRDNIADVISSHFLRLVSESKIKDVVSRRE